jgi:hypothetical protein
MFSQTRLWQTLWDHQHLFVVTGVGFNWEVIGRYEISCSGLNLA